MTRFRSPLRIRPAWPGFSSRVAEMSPQLIPFDVARSRRQVRWRAWVPHLAWGFVILGAAIRLIGYLLCFPLWIDECLLAENLLDRGFLDLALPLENNQVAPVGFLWVELALVRLFGFSEWSLRLFPLVCGIGSLFVFRHLASRLLTGLPLVFAVGCLAVAKSPIGLSANVKPYATDLFVAVTLVTLAVEWLRRPAQRYGCGSWPSPFRWAWRFPIPPSLSAAPSAWGCWALFFAFTVARRGLPIAACNVLLCAAFAGILSLTSGPQFARDADIHE